MDPAGVKEPGLDARCRVERGVIAEQWIATPVPELAASALSTVSGEVTLAILTRGEVSPEAVDYARQRLAHVAKLIEEPILFARVKLSMAADPARPLPAMAQAGFDVNGRTV